MPEPTTTNPALSWLYFALLTVACWGVYAIFLHQGQIAMKDPANGRYKAFLFVGIAYFITAVLAPIGMLLLNKADWHFTSGGMWWSLIAGIVGAIGAFGVLLAFGAKGSPAVVMSIVFAGAPVVNAVIAISLANQWKGLRWQFIAGIVLAALGGLLVTIYKPAPKPHVKAPTQAPALDAHAPRT